MGPSSPPNRRAERRPAADRDAPSIPGPHVSSGTRALNARNRGPNSGNVDWSPKLWSTRIDHPPHGIDRQSCRRIVYLQHRGDPTDIDSKRVVLRHLGRPGVKGSGSEGSPSSPSSSRSLAPRPSGRGVGCSPRRAIPTCGVRVRGAGYGSMLSISVRVLDIGGHAQ